MQVHGLSPARGLTPACSGLAALATDARRYAALSSSVGRVSTTCSLIALGTLGRSCERPGPPAGALRRRNRRPPHSVSIAVLVSSAAPMLFSRVVVGARSLRSTEPRLSCASHLLGTRGSYTGSRFLSAPAFARPRSAQAPGRFTLRFLSAVLFPFDLVISCHIPAAARAPRRRPRSARPTLCGCLHQCPARAQPFPVAA